MLARLLVCGLCLTLAALLNSRVSNATDQKMDGIPINRCPPDACGVYGKCINSSTGECSCDPGYSGVKCQTEIDECQSSPCSNGGSCSDLKNSFKCSCAPGFTGATCQTDIDDCASHPCLHNGVCTDQANQFSCSCKAGYTGPTCQIDVDECALQPCLNNGVCTDQINQFSCSCKAGYTGQTCQTDIDECSSSPCQHGGVCSDRVDNFNCACGPGFTGKSCQTNIDDCATRPCQNGAKCTDRINGFQCACVAGYNGTTCDKDIDDCASSPCKSNGVCSDRVNDFSCACPPGYYGKECQTDRDECASNPCRNKGKCIDMANGYVCSCSDLYGGKHCEHVSPCLEGTHNCSSFATCVPYGYSVYTCPCRDGYCLYGDRCESCRGSGTAKSTDPGSDNLWLYTVVGGIVSMVLLAAVFVARRRFLNKSQEREVKRFVAGSLNPEWNQSQNPIFVSPHTSHHNPIFQMKNSSWTRFDDVDEPIAQSACSMHSILEYDTVSPALIVDKGYGYSE